MKTATFTRTREWKPTTPRDLIEGAIDQYLKETSAQTRSAAERLALQGAHDDYAHDQWRWRLDADNGEPIAGGLEGYGDVRDAMHGFELATGSVIEHEHKRVAVRVVTETIDVWREGYAPNRSRLAQSAESIDVKGLTDDE